MPFIPPSLWQSRDQISQDDFDKWPPWVRVAALVWCALLCVATLATAACVAYDLLAH